MPSVRAKFVVNQKSQFQGGSHSVKLNAVYGSGSEENKAFFAATPSGEINISCVSKDVADTFVLGKEFYIDFTPAE